MLRRCPPSFYKRARLRRGTDCDRRTSYMATTSILAMSSCLILEDREIKKMQEGGSVAAVRLAYDARASRISTLSA